jgi:hypothetical protein
MTAPTFGDIGDGEKVGAALSTDRERPRFYRTPSKTNLDLGQPSYTQVQAAPDTTTDNFPR